ncbi:MAG: PHP domain-containing protein, partial [Candidatus Tectomicrobia bacterium]|nr:PHP domain-containing protein [Candidatus Tectomicrobia bacterium]
MGPRIDLHIHTRASDGTFTPAEVIAAAAQLGLGAIALTDHDTVASVQEGARLARLAGMGYLRGVELTALRDAREIHLLGYQIDLEAPGLRRYMQDVGETRQQDTRVAVEKLVRLGLNLGWEEYQEYQAHRFRPEEGGWPLINLLKEKGYVRSHLDYFDRYFGVGRPAHIPPHYPPVARAIQAIREAGGVAILAHPASYHMNGEVVDEVWLKDLLAEGLNGLEVFTPYNHAGCSSERLLQLAQRLGLLATGGSDFHGAFTEERRLGSVEADYSLFQAVERFLASLPQPTGKAVGSQDSSTEFSAQGGEIASL